MFVNNVVPSYILHANASHQHVFFGKLWDYNMFKVLKYPPKSTFWFTFISNKDLTTFSWCSFEVSEVKGLKGDNRVEENIWKTFEKMKAWPERDHRLQLLQRAAVMETITHSGANRKLALWTSAHPVFFYLKPKAARQKSLTCFKGVSQRSGKGCIQERAGKCTMQSELLIQR